MTKFFFLCFFSIIAAAPAARACVHCHMRAILVCGPDPKHPHCHNTYVCEGGTCGDATNHALFPGETISDPAIESDPAS